MNAEKDFEIAQQLGELRAEAKNVSARLLAVDMKLDKHVQDEEARLTHIEHQLSLTRFLWLAAKAFVLSLAFALAFKFGDIKNLWAQLK